MFVLSHLVVFESWWVPQNGTWNRFLVAAVVGGVSLFWHECHSANVSMDSFIDSSSNLLAQEASVKSLTSHLASLGDGAKFSQPSLFTLWVLDERLASLPPGLTWNNTEQMLNDTNRTGPEGRCGADYQSVNIYMTYPVSCLVHLTALAHLARNGATLIFKQRGLSLADIFLFLGSVWGVGGKPRVLGGVYSLAR